MQWTHVTEVHAHTVPRTMMSEGTTSVRLQELQSRALFTSTHTNSAAAQSSERSAEDDRVQEEFTGRVFTAAKMQVQSDRKHYNTAHTYM